MNVPNTLTAIRLVLIPVFVFFLIEKEYTLALACFIIAGVTDAIDGFFARLLNQKTKVGAILDPIADKLLLNTSYIAFYLIGEIPAFLCYAVIGRDIFIVTGVGLIYLLRKNIEVKPTKISKLTTFFQIITIIVVFFNTFLQVKFNLEFYLFLVTFLLTIISGLHYAYIGVRYLR